MTTAETMSVAKAVEHFDVGRSTIFEWFNQGKLRRLKKGRGTLVSVEEMRRVIGLEEDVSAVARGDYGAGAEEAAISACLDTATRTPKELDDAIPF